MAITGRQTIDHLQILEVDSDPRISIDENVIVGSLALWDKGTNGLVFIKEGTAQLSWKRLRSEFVPMRSIGGSSSNAGGQIFNLNMSSYKGVIGDTFIIKNIYYRGDFSGSNEFCDVSIQGNNFSIGEFADNDDSILTKDKDFQPIEVQLVDIGAGIAGLTFSVSPANAVNFSPSGMPNGWWWELALDGDFN